MKKQQSMKKLISKQLSFLSSPSERSDALTFFIIMGLKHYSALYPLDRGIDISVLQELAVKYGDEVNSFYVSKDQRNT